MKKAELVTYLGGISIGAVIGSIFPSVFLTVAGGILFVGCIAYRCYLIGRPLLDMGQVACPHCGEPRDREPPDGCRDPNCPPVAT